MHIFGVIVWLGGLMFQSAVASPLIQSESTQVLSAINKINKRFVNFVWMCVWTILVTGLLMMLLNPRFLWFHYDDQWQILLGLKQVVFMLMVLYAFGYARMLQYLEMPASNGGVDSKADLYKHRVVQFRKISIALGIIALVLAAAM
jgi:putative copper export protein